MIRIALPDDDLRRLEETLRDTTDPELRHRVRIVLMAHRGRRHPDIAADTGTSHRSAQRWLNAYPDRGLDGLRPREAPGATPKLTADLAPVIRRWVIDGPAKHGLDRANWTYAELADHLFKTRGVRARQVGPPGVRGQARHPPVPADVPPPPRRPGQAGDGPGGDRRPQKGAAAGGLVPLSQDEARFPMVPTLTATLGVKGHRPVVGAWDGEHLLYVLAVVNLTTAAVHANLVDSPKDAARKTGRSKTRRLQEALAAHRRHVGRMYPPAEHKRVVLLIDNAPWHAGEPIRAALADNPHLGLRRLPSYSPQLNPVERFWRVLRRRATHNRLFDTPADLRRSLRNSLCYFQTVRDRVRSLLAGRKPKPTASPGT